MVLGVSVWGSHQVVVLSEATAGCCVLPAVLTALPALSLYPLHILQARGHPVLCSGRPVGAAVVAVLR